MDIKLLYDTAVINLPRESLIRCSDKASAVDFRILLYAAIHPDAFATSDAAAALCISEEDVIRSLCFWVYCGGNSARQKKKPCGLCR